MSANIHQPVMRLEDNTVYSCLSEASKAMGRYPQYVSERRRLGLPCFDINNNLWTFKEIKSDAIPLCRRTRLCYFDEFPGKIFNSPAEASRAIGQRSDYIRYALKQGNAIKNKMGQIMHFHLVDELES